MAAETIKRELKCYLTEGETVEIAKRAAVIVEKIEDLESEKKMVAKQFANDIANEQEELFDLSRKVRNGFEMRLVNCSIVSDYDRKEVVIFRSDTYEPIETRKMTAEELQQPLFDGPGEVVEQFPDREQMPDGSGFVVGKVAEDIVGDIREGGDDDAI